MKKCSLRKKFLVIIAGCQCSTNSFKTFLSHQMTNIGFQDVGIERNHISVAQDVMNTKDGVCYQHCNNYFEVELQIGFEGFFQLFYTIPNKVKRNIILEFRVMIYPLFYNIT